MVDSDDTIIPIPKEHWLFDISPDLDEKEVKKKLNEVLPKIEELRKRLSILKDLRTYRNALETGELFGVPDNLKSGLDLYHERYSVNCDLEDLRSIHNILQHISKYREALNLYMGAIEAKKKAKDLEGKYKICPEECDNYYPPEKKCKMGYSGGCGYEPPGKKSVRVYKKEKIKEIKKYIDESKRLYEDANKMLEKMKINRIFTEPRIPQKPI